MTEASEKRCRHFRRRILQVSQRVSALHVAPAFSCIEILDTIYDLMQPDDVFIMSKGHAAIAQYVILAERGILTEADLNLYCQPGGRLGTHPDYGTPGIHASTGSLGHGLGIAVGQAYAEKLKGRGVKVYCLLSDGECQEGSTWEAIAMAANLKLDNLTAFIDNNDFGGLARMSEDFESFYPLPIKFEAFGWEAVTVDGHKSDDLEHVCMRRNLNDPRPGVAVCQTIKGKGVSFMEGVPIWHYRSPNADEYQRAMVELSDEPDTSDIPEQGPEFFARAKLVTPKS